MRRIDCLVIHCSATPEGKDFRAKDIRKWHLQRGFKDIGYHYVIDLDGTIEKGRPEENVGAHVSGYNSHTIGICYVGGLTADGKKAKDTRTPEQKESIIRLLMQLLCKYPEADIKGHRDFSPDKNHNGRIEPSEWIKACPSFEVRSEYDPLIIRGKQTV